MAVTKNSDTRLWEAQIGGHRFEFEKYGALEATQLLFDLGSITGKPLSGMARKSPAKGEDAEAATTSTFSLVIEKLADALITHRQLALDTLVRLSSGSRVLCDGRAVGKYDEFYAEDLMLAFDVTAANLEVQFGNFFGAALKRLGLNLKQAAPPELSGTTSNG